MINPRRLNKPGFASLSEGFIVTLHQFMQGETVNKRIYVDTKSIDRTGLRFGASYWFTQPADTGWKPFPKRNPAVAEWGGSQKRQVLEQLFAMTSVCGSYKPYFSLSCCCTLKVERQSLEKVTH